MFDNLRSDSRDKARRASRREANRRHFLQHEGKSSARCTFKWGKKVRVSNDPDFDYSNEVGGFKSLKHYGRGWGSDCKESRGFRYATVDRWLEAQVGRPWDDVWAEVCSRFDGRSYRGRELRRMFGTRWNVEYHCYVSVDGNVRDNRSCSIVYGLYVHPWTGILCNTGEDDRPWSKKNRRRRSKAFVSSEIGYKIGEDPFFIGTWEGRGRQWHYKYFLEEVGKVSKKADKNRIDAWFVMWTEVVGTEKAWKAAPYWYGNFYSEEALRLSGYEKRKVPLYGGKEMTDEWGKWEDKEVTRERRRSCNSEEIAWIKDLIRERQEGVSNKQLKENREGEIRRRSRPWGGAILAQMDIRAERRKGGVPVS